jgi:hypothetical protein
MVCYRRPGGVAGEEKSARGDLRRIREAAGGNGFLERFTGFASHAFFASKLSLREAELVRRGGGNPIRKDGGGRGGSFESDHGFSKRSGGFWKLGFRPRSVSFVSRSFHMSKKFNRCPTSLTNVSTGFLARLILKQPGKPLIC